MDPVAGGGVSCDGGPARNLGVPRHAKAQEAEQRCGIEHDPELLSDAAADARIVLVAGGARLLGPDPPQRTVSDAVVSVPLAPVVLFANSLAIAPDAHRLFGLRGPGIATADEAEGADMSAATLLLLGVSAERLAQALFMAPGAVGRLNGSKRVSSALQQHQQRAKLALIASRAVRHLGYGLTVDRGLTRAMDARPSCQLKASWRVGSARSSARSSVVQCGDLLEDHALSTCGARISVLFSGSAANAGDIRRPMGID